MNLGWVYLIACVIGAGLAYIVAGRRDPITQGLGVGTGAGVAFVITRGGSWLLIICALLLIGTVVRGLRIRGTAATTR